MYVSLGEHSTLTARSCSLLKLTFFSESSTISLPSPPKTMFLLPLLPLLLSRTAPCQIV